MDLNRKRALVTGANRGIGRAIAAALAQRGAVVLAGVREPDGYDGAGEPVRMDLSTRESIEECWAALGDRRIDVLVNNAGLMTGGLLEQQDTEEIYALFQVNLVAVTHLTKLILPAMVQRGSGKIVNNASISGYAFFPSATTYAASKAGVVAFTEALHRELKGTGVDTLHLVTPGVETDMLDATKEAYGSTMDTSGWEQVSPEEWAGKVVKAIESDARVLSPGGRLGLAKLMSRGPAFLLDAVSARMFSRR